MDKKIFAERFRAKRMELGWSQEEASNRIPVGLRTITGWESAKTAPHAAKLKAAADALGVSVAWLSGEDAAGGPAAVAAGIQIGGYAFPPLPDPASAIDDQVEPEHLAELEQLGQLLAAAKAYAGMVTTRAAEIQKGMTELLAVDEEAIAPEVTHVVKLEAKSKRKPIKWKSEATALAESTVTCPTCNSEVAVVGDLDAWNEMLREKAGMTESQKLVIGE